MDERTGYRTRCILCIPIKDQSGDVLGVIEAINKKKGTFTDSDMDLLKALSSIVAISIENAMLFHEQHRQFRSILEVLAASIDAKDHLTAGHSEKVTKYAIGIAHELGFAETEIDVLNVASLLHDYGKLGTDEKILKKPGRLTPEEFEHIKRHAAGTLNILNKMYLMRRYLDVPIIASCHHERLDGSGYVDGLKAHEIPFMTKIVAVADVFEALTAKRHYREPLSPKDAFEILEQGSGTKFDEGIVTALKRYWYKHCGN
jgi:HD-GYP domain-containing protein (c-di-GMP phosphodiesterase class II)